MTRRALNLPIIVVLALSMIPAPSTATDWTMDISEPEGAKIGQTFWVNVTGEPGASISISFWKEPGYHIGIGYTKLLNETGHAIGEVCIADPVYTGNYTVQIFYNHESMVRVTNYTITYNESYWLRVLLSDREDYINGTKDNAERHWAYTRKVLDKYNIAKLIILIESMVIVLLVFRKPITGHIRERREMFEELDAIKKRRGEAKP